MKWTNRWILGLCAGGGSKKEGSTSGEVAE